MTCLIGCANVWKHLWIILRNGEKWWSHWRQRRWWGQKGLYEIVQTRTSIRYCWSIWVTCIYIRAYWVFYTLFCHIYRCNSISLVLSFSFFPLSTLVPSVLLPLPSHLFSISPFLTSVLHPSPLLPSLGYAHRSNWGPSGNSGGVEQSTQPTFFSGIQSTSCEPMFVWNERSIYCMPSGVESISNDTMSKLLTV